MGSKFAWLVLGLWIIPGCGEVDPGPGETPTVTETPAPPTPNSCSGAETPTPTPPTPEPDLCEGASCSTFLRISEVVADNDGAYIDEWGEADDYFEVENLSSGRLSLAGFQVSDRDDEPWPLPSVVLPPGGVMVFFADEQMEQGDRHLPFKLSSKGETLYLQGPDGSRVDTFTWPAVLVNDAWMRLEGDTEPILCRFATPAHKNGPTCGAPPPPEYGDDVKFCPYTFPAIYPPADSRLTINEVVLSSEGFVELLNNNPAPVSLAGLTLTIAPLFPGQPWPRASEGYQLDLPEDVVLAGDYVVVPVPQEALTEVMARPEGEGGMTLYGISGDILSQVDFLSWPEGAALTRWPDGTGAHQFCHEHSPGEANTSCDPVESRPVGSYLRHLETPGDFGAMGAGEPKLGVDGVKFIVDLDMGGQVYLLNAAVWDLHYTFVREVIEGLPHLDRCDPEEAAEFNAGWSAFSQENYYTVEGRRYLLGWLSYYSGSGLKVIEYSTADEIAPYQMVEGLFAAIPYTLDPTEWSIHAQDDEQVTKMLSVGGQAPVVSPGAPYTGMTWQPLNEGEAYGTLRFIPSSELEQASLGFDVIVLTDEVPLDIDMVGGIITEAFQTPLSHVAVLSKNRGTPNMALADARNHPDIAPYLDQLVHLTVTSGGFEVEKTTAEEATAFWEAQRPQGSPQVPGIDLETRGIQPLNTHSLGDIPTVGAKAAQLAELGRLARSNPPTPVNIPNNAFAIPMVYYVEHFERSGAKTYLAELMDDPNFEADPSVREVGLTELRQMILDTDVDEVILGEVEEHVRALFGDKPVRFRSSSNTEDIPGFSGAGLYTSVSAAVDSEDQPVDLAMKTVWASLWNQRAYEERAYFNVAQEGVAMAILCHEAFPSERANGVAISRNVLDPTRNSYYINSQFGEAAVTNPAPGVVSDEFLYRFGVVPPTQYLGYSSFSQGEPVLSVVEADTLAATLKEIHTWFKPLIDPQNENQYFAMDIEFKLLGDDRTLLVKQARPFSYGAAVSDPCP